jgi:hypothetical protein
MAAPAAGTASFEVIAALRRVVGGSPAASA